MRTLFVSGAGILPEQRVHRWKMVSRLYAHMAESLRALGHRTYFYVHPEAWDDALPEARCWTHPGHDHFDYVLDSVQPDFVFCWNGSSPGDRTTATMASAAGAKMVYSEQGWFPQSATLYFDMTGTNARCGTRRKRYAPLGEKERVRFLKLRADYISACGIGALFDPDRFILALPDLSKPVFVPLQDERDLNIVQDSPFKTMDAFVGFLTTTWPELRFRVRPHPKFPSPALSAYPNVDLDDPKRPMFDSLAQCGMVMGINSTTLLEAALLGKTVISFGESLATGTGLLVDAKPDAPPDPSRARVETSAAEAVLLMLLRKQMRRDGLSRPAEVLGSMIFAEMRRAEESKPLQAWL